MKIIKIATKADNCNIISVDNGELKLFEMQKAKKVKNAVQKSIQNMLQINNQLVSALKSATQYHNLAYRNKIELTYTEVTLKPKGKKK
jgi:hypothetical protein